MDSKIDKANNSLKKTAISSAQWKFSATIIISLLALLQLYILTKYIGLAVFGIIAIGKVLLGFMTHLSDSGMRNALLVKQDLTDKLFASIYWINIGLVICLSLVMYWMTPWICHWYEMPSLELVLYIFIVAFIANALGIYYKALLQKKMRIRIISIIEILAMFLGVVISIVLAIENPMPSALAYGILTQVVVAALGFFFFGYKIHPLKMQFQRNGLKYFFNFGGFQVGERMLNYFHSKIDVLIIGKLLGSEILGVYDIFKQLLNRPESLINPVLDFVALPMMAKKETNNEKIGRIYLKMMSYSATILFPIYGLLILIAPFFVQYFFGFEWVKFTNIFQLLCLYFIVHSMLNHVGTLWIAVSKPEVGFYWNLAVWIILPVTLYFAAQYNIQMVVVAMIAILILLFYPLYHYVVQKLVLITWKDYILSIFRPLLISFIAFIPFYYITTTNIELTYSILASFGFGIMILTLYNFYHKGIFDELKSLLPR